MTAADRLKQLSGLAGAAAATMMLVIGSGATAGEILVDYSKLSTGTAAEHLLTEIVSEVVSGGVGGGGFASSQSHHKTKHDDHDQITAIIKRDDEEVMLIVQAFLITRT